MKIIIITIQDKAITFSEDVGIMLPGFIKFHMWLQRLFGYSCSMSPPVFPVTTMLLRLHPALVLVVNVVVVGDDDYDDDDIDDHDDEKIMMMTMMKTMKMMLMTMLMM